MSYLVVLIVDDIDDCPAILKAWEEAGVLGITILESTGLGRIRRAGLREDFPLMPNLRDLLADEEIHHRTLFSVVEDHELVKQMVDSAQAIIGDLEDAHTGFLFVVPVLEVYGLGKHRTNRAGE
jgi:nitrogen regulatory protein PII